MYKISVIIPTLNEEKFVGAILRDLEKQTHKAFEIIVVDGRSRDKTSEVVKKYPSINFIQTKANPAFQRDNGAKVARGDIFVFLDADTRVSENFLNEVQIAFSKKTFSLTCPFYLPTENHIPSMLLYYFFNSIFFIVQKILPSGAGSCIIVRKETYKKLGGFEEKFTYDDMQFLSKAKGRKLFAILPITVRVSNRRIRKMGLLKSFMLYTTLSWYFIKGDYSGANRIHYPFG